MLYLIQDNGYAISVTVETQTAGGSISALVRGFPHLRVHEVDGCDPLASWESLRAAVAWCRERRGPALVHAHVVRPYSHSLSDDQAHYRLASERQAEAQRDPLPALRQRLIRKGLANEETLSAIDEEVRTTVAAATGAALGRPPPTNATPHGTSSPAAPIPRRWPSRGPRPGSASRARWSICSRPACATSWRATDRRLPRVLAARHLSAAAGARPQTVDSAARRLR